MAVRSSTAILLRDVAKVKQGSALKFGDAIIMGKPAVVRVSAQYGANTLTTTRAIEAA